MLFLAEPAQRIEVEIVDQRLDIGDKVIDPVRQTEQPGPPVGRAMAPDYEASFDHSRQGDRLEFDQVREFTLPLGAAAPQLHELSPLECGDAVLPGARAELAPEKACHIVKQEA